MDEDVGMTARDQLRARLKRTPLRPLVLALRERHREWAWKRGRGPAPHAMKAAIVREYSDRHGLRCLVETGTYLGEMIEAQSEFFDRILSVELQDELHAAAVDRFGDVPNVELFHGDSSLLLPTMIDDLDEPALFWLDAHYSGGVTARGEFDTPISSEVETVLARHLPDVVLVDDARCFDGTSDYPSIAEFCAEVVARRPDMMVEVADDIIRIAPSGKSN